jgi:hypothetical protein
MEAALDQLLRATRQQVVATMAAAIMTSSGRPYSIQEALDIMHDISHAMYPEPNTGSYVEWAKTSGNRLAKVYGGHL